MREMREQIPIFFTIDDHYAPNMGIALYSMIQNASKEYHYRIHVIHQGLSEKNRRKIEALGNENFEIRFYEMKDKLSEITDREENRLRCDYFSLTIYFRLFIADMFPEYDKAIYVDSDIVVPGDISEMYNLNLGDYIIGACHDFSIEELPELVNYIENAVGVGCQEYINSGVLLMDLKRLRELRFSEKFLGLLTTYHFDCVAPDQDYLNAMCNGHILYLDQAWDVMPQEGKADHPCPKLIHYNLFEKPWCYRGKQYEDYFWKYAEETSFYEDVRRNLEEYSEEQAKHDAESMATLIHKADWMPSQEITFKKMYEKGKEIRICS